jgi:kynurenine formamidase
MTVAPVPDWLAQLHATYSASASRLGTAASITADSRRRGMAEVTDLTVLSLARSLRWSSTGSADVDCELSVSHHVDRRFVSTQDELSLACHGLGVTHLDALNHFGVDGRLYRGARPGSADEVSVDEFAGGDLVTRCIFLDIPAARGTDRVDIAHPVTGEDFERALELAAVESAPGDALVVYMGRDHWEEASGPLRAARDSPDGRPGIGESGARWLGERRASILAWDMLDACHRGAPWLPVHQLIWAFGQVLVDNCDLSALHAAMVSRRRKAGLLVVAPLPIPGATGCAVNPLVML